MRKTREILRLKWELGLSHRAVSRSLKVGLGTVSLVLARARSAGIDEAGLAQLSDDELDGLLYRGPVTSRAGPARASPDFQLIHRERRRPGVTLELLHLEYLERHPDGYRYSQFCERYRRWLKDRGLSMRQVHRAGEKLFVDYSGKRPRYVDAGTGAQIDCELFVAVLGASNYTFVEATRTQRSEDWIASHARAFEFFGGVTALVVPDQLKSGVTTADRYEPGVQRTYEELATHYDTAVLPARPRKPKDKAKVEVGVQVAQRWILARLRNETFFSLAELNERIAELLVDLNDRQMKLYGVSRRELFELLDRPMLRPLPAKRFEYAEWQTPKVSIDYHVEVDHHFYSVPYQLVGKKLDVRMTATTVEVCFKTNRVASHRRSFVRGRVTTLSEHMPKAHREHLKWSPSRLIAWGEKVGPRTAELVAVILDTRRHPEQGYRSCLGILRLSKRYGEERLERACERALAAGARSYRHVDSILKCGLDRVPMADESPEQPSLPLHDNVRGGTYYA
ncbi:IS21 family transposase [bacterium]|nr:IS21 family transposase [bacterium]